MAKTMADLGNRIWDDNEMQAFSASENTRKYQDYKKQLEDDYDKNYSIGGNFLNWLGTGLSGGGWSKGDFLKNRGITDETDAYGNAGYFGNTSMGDLRNYGSDYNKSRLEQLEAGKGLFSGVPIVGELLSAPTQVVSAGKDLVEGGLSKWQNGKRDWLSDLGALGETGLDIATLGTASGATAGAKTLGKTIGKGALLGAGYGATGALNDMGAKNFDLGRLALSTGIGAGVGGGISGLGYGLGKVWNKYSQPAPSKSTDMIPYTGGGNMADPKLQEYMKTLGVTGDNMTAESLNSARKQATKNIAKNMGYETAEGQAQRTAVNNAYQALLESLNGKGATVSAPVTTAPSLSFVDKLKNFGSNIPNMGKDLANTKIGTNVANLLKTKRGKVLLGGSAGLTLAGLMKNKNDNSGQLTDEEMQELYNYIYGGGQ